MPSEEGDQQEQDQLRRLAEARQRAWANRDPEMEARFRVTQQQRARNRNPISAAEIRDLPEDELHDRLVGRLFTVVSSDVSDLGGRPGLLRACYVTKHFEGEVMNGGLHQFFMNNEDETYWELIVEGYTMLGLQDVASVLSKQILPVARQERRLRSSLTSVIRVSKSYKTSQLPALDELVEVHDELRDRIVRQNPLIFQV